MLTSHRGTVRLDEFSEALETLSESIRNLHSIVDGAIWEIERDPEGIGKYIKRLDIWCTKLAIPPIFLFYVFNRRYVTMLTIVEDDGSIEL